MRSALTGRQKEVLRQVAAGHTSTQIGRQLGISHSTVARHLAEIYKTLGAHDRAHAVTLAIWRGEITLAQLADIANSSSRQLRVVPEQETAA